MCFDFYIIQAFFMAFSRGNIYKDGQSSERCKNSSDQVFKETCSSDM